MVDNDEFMFGIIKNIEFGDFFAMVKVSLLDCVNCGDLFACLFKFWFIFFCYKKTHDAIIIIQTVKHT